MRGLMRADDGVSIVIPAHNEAARLPGTLARILEYGRANRGCVAEIIVVDDGSRDETAAVARRYATTEIPIHVISYSENAGKGYAIRRGILAAEAPLILLSDADLSTPIEELETLRAALEGHDIVIGSRAIDESLVKKRQGWLRQWMGRTFNRIVRKMTRIPYADTQCGFKLLASEAAKPIFRIAVIDRFAFDVEMIVIASKLGFRIAEVPVHWFNSPDSRVHIIRDSALMLKDVFFIRRIHGTFVERGRANP
jgi:dolichyl-phosphate beta-glucosyltransferase